MKRLESSSRRLRWGSVALLASIQVAIACGGSQDIDIPPDEGDAAPGEGGASDARAEDGQTSTDGGTPDGSQIDGSLLDGETDATTDGAIDGGTDAPSDASFDVAVDATLDAPADAPSDTGADVGVDAAVDAPVDSPADAPDDAPSDAGADVEVDAGSDAGGCPAPDVSGAERHLYVDKTVVTSGNGSETCPFKTILEATTAATAPPVGSKLTIHVQGATATLYAETAPLVIGARTTLTSQYPPAATGDPARVTIRTRGACATGIECAVSVTSGTLDGLTIDTPGSDEIHGVLANAYPKIQNVTIQGASGSGIFSVAGGVEIGPGVYSSNNGDDGLRVNMDTAQKGTVLRIVAGGRGNRFDNNGRHGIHVLERWGHIEISSARANGNNSVGLYIEPESPTQHVFENVTASSNTVVGLRVLRGPVSVIGGTFESNGIHGVFFGNGNNNGSKFAITDSVASGNGTDGVRLDTSDLVTIEGLVARENGKSPGNAGGGSGVLVGLGTSLKLRKSVLLGNTVGISFAQQRSGGGTALTTLDIGPSAADSGSNTFGATPSTSNNVKAGICILRAGVSGSQKAFGNAWTSCPVTQTLIAGVTPDCYDAASYSDVVFVPNTVGNVSPVDTGGASAPECLVGTP